jgi:hypothetical protein
VSAADLPGWFSVVPFALLSAWWLYLAARLLLGRRARREGRP